MTGEVHKFADPLFEQYSKSDQSNLKCECLAEDRHQGSSAMLWVYVEELQTVKMTLRPAEKRYDMLKIMASV